MQTHTHTQHAFVLCSSVQAGCSACVRARGGRKKDVLDIFGSWTPMEDFSIAALRQASLPHPLVNSDDILEWNFEWGPEHTIPYETFDALRLRHGIDVTGLNLSLTHRGNLYRSYALLRGAVG